MYVYRDFNHHVCVYIQVYILFILKDAAHHIMITSSMMRGRIRGTDSTINPVLQPAVCGGEIIVLFGSYFTALDTGAARKVLFTACGLCLVHVEHVWLECRQLNL